MITTIGNIKRKYFDYGSCCVFGMRGRGKDMLMANIAVRNKQHISNINYGEGYIPLDFDKIDVGNKYSDFISCDVKPFVYPYPEGVDIFISDIGVYFPSQYYDALNKRYPTIPTFLALSRQLGLCNVHLNTQHLGRPWDKFREQSDIYIHCNKVKVIKGVVIQTITVYENYETALAKADPFWYPPCKLIASRDERQTWRNNRALALAKYLETHGNVKRYTMIYRNKSNYDTRYFNTLLRKETPNEKAH